MKVAYWIVTVLSAGFMLMSGYFDLAQPPQLVEGLTHMGFPLYFATLLGIWKVLSVPALLVAGVPRLKEWAYAGIFFDLTGAAYSHLAAGDGVGKAIVPLVIGAVVAASWALRPESRRLKPA